MRSLRDQIVEKWFERMRADVALDRGFLANLERTFSSAEAGKAVDRERLLKVTKTAPTAP
jgi:hypothetical protein